METGRTLLAVLCTWLCGPAVAQVGDGIGKDRMMLFGVVTEEKDGTDLGNVTVLVVTDSIARDSAFTDALGRYQVFVPLQGVHRLVYALEGHHRKVVQVDTNGEMDEAARKQEWNLRIDIGLEKAEVALSDDLLNTPIGIAAWQPQMREFTWDRPYTERYRARYKQAMKAAGRK